MTGLAAGRLDRRVIIQNLILTPNAYGEPIESWATFATVWAEVRDLRGREFFSAQQVNAEVETIFRIRWLAGVLATMRISYDSKAYDILGIAEIGRHDGLELMAKARVA